MKTLSAELQAHEAADSTNVVDAYKVTRRDGQVFGFLDHDVERLIDGVTYRPDTIIETKAVQMSEGSDADNTETGGGFDDSAITEEDLAAGRWAGALVEPFTFNWADLSMGIEKGSAFCISEVTRTRVQFKAELLSLKHLLAQTTLGKLLGRECETFLYSPFCKVRRDPPAWEALTPYTRRLPGAAETGSVVMHASRPDKQFRCDAAGTSGAAAPTFSDTVGGTTTDDTVTWITEWAVKSTGTITGTDGDGLGFTVSALAFPVDYLGEGTAEFLDGANAGVVRDIRIHEAGGHITLKMPAPNAIEVGDIVLLRAGCRRDEDADCAGKFDNRVNSRAYGRHTPSPDFLASGEL